MAKQKLYVFTLEPIEKRYTKQWYDYWFKEFSKHFDVIYIDGNTEQGDEIKEGRFLDINMTNVWKAEQVANIAKLFSKKKIKDGDSVIFMDAWHFGVTAVKYMSQLNNVKVKLYGYWHAGTYDEHDFVAQAGLGSWAKYNELGWINALDGHFVATKYHKDILVSFIKKNIEDFNTDKIHIVGFPMDWEEYISKEIDLGEEVEKKNIVVFPHRLDPEKCPETFDWIANKLPRYKFVKTIDVTKNKKEYYELLRKAKVVFSANKQETYGIGTVEALLLGCVPVVPDRLTYPEMYYSEFVYKNLNEAIDIIVSRMEDIVDYSISLDLNAKSLKQDSLESISKMAKIIKGE